MEVAKLNTSLLTVILISLISGVLSGDIVHHDDKSPTRPGCDNDFVLVIFYFVVNFHFILCTGYTYPYFECF